MQKRKRLNYKLLIPAVIALGIGAYFIPPVNARLAPRLDSLRSQIKYLINPPDEAVFQPQQQSQVDAAATQLMQTFEATRSAASTAEPASTPTPGPTGTPTITSTPLPASAKITDFKYIDQKNRWNYCGPANLTMALNHLGWNGNRDIIAKAIKPGIQDPKLDFIQQGRSDVNVMPYEMVDFVNDQTEFRALSRLGGDIDLAKRLLAAGFPFIAEKGYYEKDYTGRVAWLGHSRRPRRPVSAGAHGGTQSPAYGLEPARAKSRAPVSAIEWDEREALDVFRTQLFPKAGKRRSRLGHGHARHRVPGNRRPGQCFWNAVPPGKKPARGYRVACRLR